MKLVRTTYYNALLLSIPAIIIGSIFCFYIIKYINYEETDEYLTYEMERIISYYDETHDFPEFNSIVDVLDGVYYQNPVFKDTLLLETGDNELVPFRQLSFTINYKSEYCTVVLRDLLMGTDDIVEGTLLIIIGVIMLTFLFQILMIQAVNKKLWQPFYLTIAQLQTFKIGNSVPQFSETDIDEFKALNNSLQLLLEKIIRDYKTNKEFNENASHELQTHLAVIRARTELLINESDKESIGLQEIYNASRKLSQIQRALLLLSKISNSEFTDNVNVNLKSCLENTFLLFGEALEIQNIKVTTALEDTTIYIDKGLADILINNLVKNAIKHNVKDGFIDISLNKYRFTIKNSSVAYAGNPNSLFQRFVKGKSGATGIGLAIVKQICDIYHFQISYTITEEAYHTIEIVFNKEQ